MKITGNLIRRVMRIEDKGKNWEVEWEDCDFQTLGGCQGLSVYNPDKDYEEVIPEENEPAVKFFFENFFKLGKLLPKDLPKETFENKLKDVI
jgi:nitrogen fixation protein